MKITPEDMDDVRDVLKRAYNPFARDPITTDEQRDTALALILVRIYDRGYATGWHEHSVHTVNEARQKYPQPCRGGDYCDEVCTDNCPSPYTQCPYDFSHTRHWCGYEGCRDS